MENRILQIIHKIENDYKCHVLMVYWIGSQSVDNVQNNSDLDIVVITDTIHSRLWMDDFDIWVYSLQDIVFNCFITNSCSINIFDDNIIYCYNEDIFSFIDKYKNELIKESLILTYKYTCNTIEKLTEIPSVSFCSKKSYSCLARDIIYSLQILDNNLHQPNDIFTISNDFKQLLRDIRGKDGRQISYNKCFDIINSYMSREFTSYYNSLNIKPTHLIQLIEKLGEIMEQTSTIYSINQFKFLLSLQNCEEPPHIELFDPDTVTDKEVLEFLTTINKLLISKYGTLMNKMELYSEIIEILHIQQYFTKSIIESIFMLVKYTYKSYEFNSTLWLNFLAEILSLDDSCYKDTLVLFALENATKFNLFDKDTESIAEMVNILEANSNPTEIIKLLVA